MDPIYIHCSDCTGNRCSNILYLNFEKKKKKDNNNNLNYGKWKMSNQKPFHITNSSQIPFSLIKLITILFDIIETSSFCSYSIAE